MRSITSFIQARSTQASARRIGCSRMAMLVAVIGGGVLLGGCSNRLQQFTGSISDFGRGATGERGSGSIVELGRRYDAKPGDKRNSLAYAAALRANGQHPQAVAVLQRTSIDNVGDREVAAAYGKALADVGQLEQANAVLAQAHTEDRPDWRVLSAQGSIADQLGNHVRARELYHRALQIAPNEPSVLNNLGLSYVLTKELALAEETLRKAAGAPGADARIQANLALALRLRGKGGATAALTLPGATAASVKSASAEAGRPALQASDKTDQPAGRSKAAKAAPIKLVQ